MRVTASRLPLLRACRWWARPEVDAPALPGSDAAALGTQVHAAIEARLRGKEPPPLPPVGRACLAAWERDCHDPAAGWRPEVRVAWRPATGEARLLPDGRGHRDYTGVCSDEVAGTADAVRVEDGCVCVADWKIQTGPDGYAEPAATNAQLAFYALALARANNCDEAEVRVVRISVDGCEVDAHRLDAFDLEAVATEVRALLDAVPGSEPAPGPHCADRWCPAVGVCPAMVVAAQQLVRLSGDRQVVVTPETAAPLYERLHQVRAAADAMEVVLRLWADVNDGIRLPSGAVWEGRDEVRESIALDEQGGAEARDVLARAGLDCAIRTKTTCSWTDVRDVLKSLMPGKDKAVARREAEKALRDALNAAGALRGTTTRSYRERKPPRGAKGAAEE